MATICGLPEILHCTGPFPFDEVLFERDNRGAYGQERGKSSSRLPTQTVRERRKGDDSTAEIHEDADPTDEDAPVIFPEFDETPVYDQVPVSRIPPTTSDEPKTRRSLVSAEPAAAFSGGARTRDGSYTEAQFQPVNQGEGDEDTPGSLAYFRAAAEKLPEVAATAGLDVKCRVTAVAFRWHKDVGPRLPWANMREGERTRPRRLMIASVTLGNRHFALIEIERRPSEKFATLGIHQVSAFPIPAGILERVKLAIAKNHGNLDDDARWTEHQLDTVERLNIHHHERNVPAEKYTRHLLVRLTRAAGDDPPKWPGSRSKPAAPDRAADKPGDDEQLAS